MYLALMLAKDSETEEDVCSIFPPYYNNINISRNYYNQETEIIEDSWRDHIGVKRIKMENHLSKLWVEILKTCIKQPFYDTI